jgi:hypothetical protein
MRAVLRRPDHGSARGLWEEVPTSLNHELDMLRCRPGGSACARLPSWSKAAQLVCLLQPSSAMVERVFSILQRQYPRGRRGMLRDGVELGAMLAYNRYRGHEDD